VGDGMACADRNHSSYLYRFAETALLFDCGEPVSRSFKATGLDYDTIDRIFLSHLHSDHVGGFFMLMQGFWLEPRRKELVVHLPADAIEPLRRMLSAAYLFDELFQFRLRFEPLREGNAVAQGQVRVTPYRTSHLETLRKSFQKKYPGDYAAHAFLIETEKVRIVHSADLGAPGDLEPLLTRPVDLLVCELAHFQPKDLFGYLKGRDIQRIFFVHLGRWHWDKLTETRRLAMKTLSGMKVSFARDQQVFGF
jgi:ribonuclease Z